MKTYAERLAWAMECRGLSPHTDQSTLAKLIGPPCKPQNIQHLLDQNKNAKSSKYTPRIADVLRCDVLWLAEGTGRKPEPDDRIDPFGETLETIKTEKDSKSRVYLSSSESNTYGKVPTEQLDEFIAELKAAAAQDRLSPHRFFLLRELLREGAGTHGASIEKQQIKTRGGHGRQDAVRPKTGTGKAR